MFNEIFEITKFTYIKILLYYYWKFFDLKGNGKNVFLVFIVMIAVFAEFLIIFLIYKSSNI